MKKYNKIIVSRFSPENKCFALENEWLIIADLNGKNKLKIKKTEHYFIGINSGLPSVFGWVYKLNEPISISEYLNSAKIIVSNEIKINIEFLLDSISNIEEGKPVACSFRRIGIIEKQDILKVHRVFFYDVKTN
jgi:hypothetical protein